MCYFLLIFISWAASPYLLNTKTTFEFMVYIQGLMKGKCKTMTEKFNNDYFNWTTYIVRLF